MNASRRNSGNPLYLNLLQGEIKSRAFANLRFRPDAASVLMNHTLNGCQANAYPLKILAPVEPLENAEQLVDVPHIEADPVVAHVNHGRFIAGDLADLNDGGLTVDGELDRIGQQIHHNMLEEGRVAVQHRQFADAQIDVAFLQNGLEGLDGFVNQGPQVGGPPGDIPPPQS